jgi:predicted AlkP superfamily pyrophosphatase or phosphodiesterase
MQARKKLLVIQCAGLGYDFLVKNGQRDWHGLTFKPLESVFPAVTCPAQATFRTGLPPSRHGIVGNGFLVRQLMKPLFWEQSARLVEGPRIWDSYRAGGGRVGMFFWQQSLGESVDCTISPAPIHKHHGGMIESCYSKPAGLYDKLCTTLGRPFRLSDYWGPMASAKCSDWIAEAVAALIADSDMTPGLCLAYLPALDYDLQRYGPESNKARAALRSLMIELEQLHSAAVSHGYDVLVFGDYAIASADKGAVLLNVVLREAGLFAVRNIDGMLYPDLHSSRAFAVVDHEIAHVYIQDAGAAGTVAELLRNTAGVGEVLDNREQETTEIRHARSGELVLTAADGHWFAYPWWTDDDEAPDYASHVDIHNKPGYDPCELFFGWPPFSVSRNTAKIKGSHGRTGKGRQTCWTSTCKFDGEPERLADLAEAVQEWLG